MKRIPNINHLYTNGAAKGVTFAALKYGNSAQGTHFYAEDSFYPEWAK